MNPSTIPCNISRHKMQGVLKEVQPSIEVTRSSLFLSFSIIYIYNMQHEFSIVPVLICNIKCNNEVFPACKEAFFINLQFSFEQVQCFFNKQYPYKLWRNPLKDAAFLLKKSNLLPNDVVSL